MDISSLKYFVAIAEAGSFSRAAAVLYMTQPSLSRQVQLLEEEFGQRLLERHGRGVRLTESGAAMLAHARTILEATEQARSDMLERQHNPRGRLVVSLPHRVAQVITPDLVEQFHAKYPDAGITVTEGLSVRLREALIAGRADLAVLFDPAPSPQIHQEILVREDMVLISKRPLPQRVRLSDLADRQLVMPSAPNAIRRLLEEHTGPRGIALQFVAEVDSVHTVLRLVARGVADSIVPASAPRQWGLMDRLNIAEIHAPAIRNRLVLATPTARTHTRLTTFGTELLRDLIQRHFGPGE
ncbi:MAG: HTH-type transcriptional regulator CynR [Paracidovorax wautersii]|uniref:HTH-type transcriptional regulator CynR n=1 Tax=Paracidovorax wautersii TaxID=1177982 RepID=A0A7V8FKU1_9BURK|nr:MAG: HTH-type transcriptional regulator CynR [Paracidovorax wautersii]